jgi:hypothetical protein
MLFWSFRIELHRGSSTAKADDDKFGSSSVQRFKVSAEPPPSEVKAPEACMEIPARRLIFGDGGHCRNLWNPECRARAALGLGLAGAQAWSA